MDTTNYRYIIQIIIRWCGELNRGKLEWDTFTCLLFVCVSGAVKGASVPSGAAGHFYMTSGKTVARNPSEAANHKAREAGRRCKESCDWNKKQMITRKWSWVKKKKKRIPSWWELLLTDRWWLSFVEVNVWDRMPCWKLIPIHTVTDFACEIFKITSVKYGSARTVTGACVNLS